MLENVTWVGLGNKFSNEEVKFSEIPHFNDLKDTTITNLKLKEYYLKHDLEAHFALLISLTSFSTLKS